MPTTLALRYLDLSGGWFSLNSVARDKALDYVEHGKKMSQIIFVCLVCEVLSIKFVFVFC